MMIRKESKKERWENTLNITVREQCNKKTKNELMYRYISWVESRKMITREDVHLNTQCWQKIPSTLALYVADISARSRIVVLRGTYEWRKNDVKRSERSCCICCRTWVKMAKNSCFLRICEGVFESLMFLPKYV